MAKEPWVAGESFEKFGAWQNDALPQNPETCEPLHVIHLDESMNVESFAIVNDSPTTNVAMGCRESDCPAEVPLNDSWITHHYGL
jgi:hypothetical protein